MIYPPIGWLPTLASFECQMVLLLGRVVDVHNYNLGVYIGCVKHIVVLMNWVVLAFHLLTKWLCDNPGAIGDWCLYSNLLTNH